MFHTYSYSHMGNVGNGYKFAVIGCSIADRKIEELMKEYGGAGTWIFYVYLYLWMHKCKNEVNNVKMW